MRYPASEKLEIIRLVEQSHLPARRTLEQLGIPCRTFYRWYDRYLAGGLEALADQPSAPSRVWNRLPRERSEEHTSEIQSLMRISYAALCLKKKTTPHKLTCN